MLITLFLAHLFRLNKVIALVAANISIPPMIPLLPVSYTHLDVYKRQQLGMFLLRFHHRDRYGYVGLRTPSGIAVHFPHLHFGNDCRRTGSCLLYTSYKNSNRPSSCIMTLSAKLTPTGKTDKPFRGGYRRIRCV